jgi:CubicO group peptidase (beta-lactamase class C family)
MADLAPERPASGPMLDSTASGRRLLALVGAINAGDSAAILRFGEAHYDPKALAETGGRPRLLNRWLEIRQTVGTIAIDTVLATSPTTTTAWARGITSKAWLSFRLVTDSVPPYRIQRIGLGRGLRPEHAASRMPVLRERELRSAMRAYLAGLAEADLFSGVVALSGPRGPIVSEAFGVADGTGRSLTMDTPFDLASIGKTFTAVAIGKLVEAGTLRLEDSAGRFLPALPARLGALRIDQLLEHSSGLGELGPALDSVMRRAGSVAEMLSHLTDTALAFPPGTGFQYSNRGYVLLGAIVERASGLTYREFVSSRIWQPAGMTRTSLGPIPPGDRARRYTRFPTLRSDFTPGARVEFRPQDDLAPGPHGGAYSTASDLQRFGAALMQGTLLRAGTLEQLTMPRAGAPWARGFQAGGAGRGAHFGHGGGTPGMNSLLRIFPELGCTLVVLSNYDTGANIAGAYLSELIEASAASPR